MEALKTKPGEPMVEHELADETFMSAADIVLYDRDADGASQQVCRWVWIGRKKRAMS